MLIERDAFPSLITLDVSGIEDERDFTSLPVIVRSRSNADNPVRHFNLMSNSSHVRWIKSFKEVVNDVVWDFDKGHDSCPLPSSASYYDFDSWLEERMSINDIGV